MEIYFTESAQNDFNYFKKENNHQIINKIDSLLNSIIEHDPLVGLGKPKTLQYYDPSAYSRRITNVHRLVYRIKNNKIYVLSCRDIIRNRILF